MTDPRFPAGHRVRTQVLFAATARSAVVLRTGPKRHHQLLLWDLEADAFTPGQWMKGLVRLQDLAPDAGKLIYWAAQYHVTAAARSRVSRRVPGHLGGSFEPLRAATMGKPRRANRRLPRYLRNPDGRKPGEPPPRPNQGCWTAISVPPYFSALAIWPSFGHWTGGGAFRPEGSIVLFESADGMTPVENTPLPAWQRQRLRPVTREEWSLGAALLSSYHPHPQESPLHSALARDLRACGANCVDWISLRDGADMLFAADGAIYRLPNWVDIPASDYVRKAWLLVDLTASRFELIAPPDAALVWP